MIENLPAGNKLFGFYRGQVLKHCEHGRCKLWIPSVYPIEWRATPDIIPDAEQAAPLFGGSFSGNGMFSWPDIGSIVWCFFLNGDLNLPVYFAASLGGIDAYDQYVRCANSDSEFLQEPTAMHTSEILEISRAHRINSGNSSITINENGNINTRTEFPLESTTGTMGANCTYAEYLLHFYADKGIWEYSDIIPVEDGTLRVGLTVNSKSAASDFVNAFKEDVAATPPAIDVFFYVVGSKNSGNKETTSTELTNQENELPPKQDNSFEQTAQENKNTIYFCTAGRRFDDVQNVKFLHYSNLDAISAQLKFATEHNYTLFVCLADFFLDSPIVKNYDMANLREINDRKSQVKSIVDLYASEFGISILAICPKHTYSDLVLEKSGILSGCTFNDYTLIKSTMNIDVDGKISAYTGHIMSADMLSQTSWDDLGESYSRMSIDSAGNSFLDGVYTTKTTEVSCIFDMTTMQHIKAHLDSAEVDPDSRKKKTKVLCSYDCDTISGFTDISVIYYNFDSGEKTYSKVRMTKDGEISVNCTDNLDILVKTDKGNTKSHINMNLNGKIVIDSTDSIDINAPNITLNGTNITIKGTNVEMTGSSKTNIFGNNGDCKINKVSLVQHKHQCGNSTTNVPIKQ